jgi:predicted HAD superfamily hydrolase
MFKIKNNYPCKEQIKEMIKSHDIISFDIFDTLLDRVIEQPNDILNCLDIYAQKKFSIKEFKSKRINIKNIISHLYDEEITLEDRYKEIGKHFNISNDILNHLLLKELNLEQKVLKTKPFGLELFEFAKLNEKRIILTSDTFYSREFVSNLLNVNQFIRYDKMYLSSEYYKTKLTGNLFKKITEEEGISPNKILHIGDNKKSDIINAKSHDITTALVPKKDDLSKNKLRKLKSKNALLNNLVNGMGQYHLSQNSSQINLETIGYSYIGLFMFYLADWIAETAYKKGLKELYFLSRDGKIIKEVYDIITEGRNEYPKSKYVLSSRRSTKVASINNSLDIKNILHERFTPMSIKRLLTNKFGLKEDDIQKININLYGFKCFEHVVRYNDINLFNMLIDQNNLKVILDNAQKEKKEYLDYLKSKGLDNEVNPEDFAFVDIGHAGSIQKSLANLLNLKKTNGFYFMCNKKSDEVLKLHNKFSFLPNDNLNFNEKIYNKHILMFEVMFLPSEDSFVKIANNKPVFLENIDEGNRKMFADKIHSEVKKFAHDFRAIYNEFKEELQISPVESISLYHELLKSPILKEVKLFENVSFENIFSGRDSRFIVNKKDKKAFWKEGNKTYNFPILSILTKIRNK